jgi:hypothetical protein
MRIAIPSLHIADCRHITVTKDKETESITVSFDQDVVVVTVTGPPDGAMPELEIVETAE